MKVKRHHVRPNPQGGWDLIEENQDTPINHFVYKAEAVNWGRYISKEQASELVIYKKNGTVESTDDSGQNAPV